MPPRTALLAMGVGVLLACAPGRQPADDASLSISVGIRADITGIYPNPPIINEGFTIWMNMQIFEGLTSLDQSLRLVPALADGWETPSDTSYVFQLRRGLRFSDGRALTARDVAASLNAALRNGWANRDSLQAIRSARALDEQRVEIETKVPHLVLPYELPRGFVLPADVLEKAPVPPIGAGPYRLESWEPGRELALVRNSYYRDAPPAVERGRFVVVPDGEERVARLLRGDLDAVEQVPLERLNELEQDPRVKVYRGSGNRLLFLCLRVSHGRLHDPRVRQAIDLAIDRDELVVRVYGGHAEVARQMIHPRVVGYDPQLAATPPDRSRARALLAEAGFPDGLEIRLDGPTNRYVRDVELLGEVRRQLGLVGIRVTVAAVDKVEFFRLLDSGGSDFHLLGWAFETGEAGDALGQLFHTPQAGLLGTANATGLSDPELDALIERARGSRDEHERAELLRTAGRRAAEQRSAIPLVIQPEAVATSRRLVWDPPLNYALRLTSFRARPE